MSLVANYTDSEDEDVTSDGEDEKDKKERNTDAPEVEVKPVSEIPKSPEKYNIVDDDDDDYRSGANNSDNKAGVNFLDFQQQSSSSENSSDSESEEMEGKLQKRKFIKPLDNPFRYFGSGSVAAEDSVLRVEFREQEAQKTAVLERHVKMSAMAGAALTINGKKICWNHRKGKCRFGHNCKFAHDSDILPTNADGSLPEKTFAPTSATMPPTGPETFSQTVNDEDTPATTVYFASSAHLSGDSGTSKRKKTDELMDDEEVGDSKLGKKKRPGLSSGLVPGKKTMNMYYKTKTS